MFEHSFAIIMVSIVGYDKGSNERKFTYCGYILILLHIFDLLAVLKRLEPNINKIV